MAPFPTVDAKVQVSTAGGALPRWRQDGREIFYLAGNTLMAAPVTVQGATLQVGEVQPLFQVQRLGNGYPYDAPADGQRFLVSASTAEGAAGPPTVVVNWQEELRRLVPTE